MQVEFKGYRRESRGLRSSFNQRHNSKATSYVMKKIIFFFLLFAPLTGHAYVSYWRTFPFFSYGLSSFTVTKANTPDGVFQQLVIKGDDVSKIKLDDKQVEYADMEKGLLRLTPHFVETGLYDFWKIKGTYKDKPLLIAGLTIEGDLIDNKITFHAIIIFLILLGVVYAIHFSPKHIRSMCQRQRS